MSRPAFYVERLDENDGSIVYYVWERRDKLTANHIPEDRVVARFSDKHPDYRRDAMQMANKVCAGLLIVADQT